MNLSIYQRDIFSEFYKGVCTWHHASINMPITVCSRRHTSFSADGQCLPNDVIGMKEWLFPGTRLVLTRQWIGRRRSMLAIHRLRFVADVSRTSSLLAVRSWQT